MFFTIPLRGYIFRFIMYQRIYLSVLFLFFYSYCIGIEDTLRMDNDFKMAEIGDFGYLHTTSNLKNDVSPILDLEDEAFIPLKEIGLGFVPSLNAHWLRMVIHNVGYQKRDLMLNMEHPLMDYVQFFINRNGCIESSMLMGDYFPYADRAIEHINYLHKVSLDAGETLDIFIYTNKLRKDGDFFTSVWDKTAFQQKDRKDATGWGIFIGIVLFLFILSCIATFMTRQILLFYFSVTLIGNLLFILSYYGLGFEYVWSENPGFNQDAMFYFMLVYMMGLLALTRKYLNTHKTFPILDKILFIEQIITLIYVIPIAFTPLFSATFIIFILKLGNVLTMLISLSIIIGSIRVYTLTKKRDVIIFVLGYFFYLVSLSFMVFIMLNIVPANSITRYAIILGFILDTISLMIVVGNEVRRIFVRNFRLKQELTQTKLAAANALMEGQLNERERLSTELHDGIGLKLSLIKMKFSKFFTKQEVNGQQQEIYDELGHLAQDIRSYSHAILPLNLNETTLKEALEDMVFDVTQLSILKITLDTSMLNEKLLDKNEKNALYQTLKELLNNTVKHANAKNIKINLSNYNQNTQLKYEDDGKGFSLNRDVLGIGLKNIQSRATLLNGSFEAVPSEIGSKFRFVF